MEARKNLAAWLCGAALAVVQTCAPPAVPALAPDPGAGRAPSVAGGDTARPAGDAHTADALHDALGHELAQAGALRLAPTERDARWVVRGSVTQLERSQAAGDVEVSCAVSLVVSDARGGNVRAMLQGRARAR